MVEAVRPAPYPVYRFVDLTIDCGRRCVLRGSQSLAVNGLSFDLLVALLESAPNLMTVDDLMARVWPDVVVNPETISQRVKLLRQALGDDAHAPRYIAVVRGRGYRAIADVRLTRKNDGKTWNWRVIAALLAAVLLVGAMTFYWLTQTH